MKIKNKILSKNKESEDLYFYIKNQELDLNKI